MREHFRHFTAIIAALLICSNVPLSVDADGEREVRVSTAEGLLSALEGALPGDRIVLAPGTYENDVWKGDWSAFFSEAGGTEELPITLCSEDPEHPAVICGVSQENKVGLHIKGEYWHLEDLVVRNCSKGIVLDKASNSALIRCEVCDTGTEGIHLRDDTSNCLIEDCYVHDCGTVTAKYGEGIYIGSAKGTTGYGFDCHYNTVRNCRISNVAADCIDIKEYTKGTLVEGCTLDGCGTKGENGADSLLEIKGNDVVVRNNVGYRSGNEKIVQAVDLYNAVPEWGQNSRIYDNRFFMDRDDLFLVKGWNCSAYVFRNESEPECPAVSGNKIMNVTGISLDGDVTEDGIVDSDDSGRLQDFLLGKPDTGHISDKNADLTKDGRLSVYDMCALREFLASGNSAAAAYHVSFTEEETGSWRFCDGLGGHTLHVRLKAAQGDCLDIGWGYWDPGYVDESTGKTGKWRQFSADSAALDENGEVMLEFDIPEAATRVLAEIWTVYEGTEKLDKTGVSVPEAWVD